MWHTAGPQADGGTSPWADIYTSAFLHPGSVTELDARPRKSATQDWYRGLYQGSPQLVIWYRMDRVQRTLLILCSYIEMAMRSMVSLVKDWLQSCFYRATLSWV